MAAEAEAKGQEMAQARGINEERLRSYAIVGVPDGVREQVQRFLDAGLDGLIFNMHDPYELDSVRLARETLARF